MVVLFLAAVEEAGLMTAFKLAILHSMLPSQNFIQLMNFKMKIYLLRCHWLVHRQQKINL